MSVRWQDWANVLLGCWLAVSPWQMEYTLNHAATGNACGVGTVLVVFNLIAVCRIVDEGQEIVNILLGIWLMFSPYALDFSLEKNPAINAMAVGALIVVLAGWQIVDATREKKLPK
ncbi:MAG: SPW repeat protein [Burkholderiales bacterium]